MLFDWCKTHESVSVLLIFEILYENVRYYGFKCAIWDEMNTDPFHYNSVCWFCLRLFLLLKEEVHYVWIFFVILDPEFVYQSH